MATGVSSANRRRPTEVATPNTERSFRPDIEGLRALAVGLVLLNHAGVPWFAGGYIGVDVFFVLSGFLITGILIRELERDGSVSLARFYARRARRLLPAGTLVLVATVVMTYLVVGGARAERTAEDARWTALFLSNYRFIEQGTDYMNSTLPPSPVQHYWSLAVEEQFYLVWPLLMIGVASVARNRNPRLAIGLSLIAIVAGSLAFSIWQTPRNGTEAYFSPFTRAWELGLGGMLGEAATQVRRIPDSMGSMLGWAGLAAVLFAAMQFDRATIFPGYVAVLPVLGTCLVVIGGSIAAGNSVGRMLAFGPVQLVGRYSYSLYLWHWPVLVIAAAWAGRELRIRESLLLCLVALGLAAGTYHLLEHPVRDSGWLKGHKAAWSIGLGGALTLAALLVATSVIRVVPDEPIAAIAADGTITLPTNDEVVQAVDAGTQVTEWPPQPPRIENAAYSEDCDVTRADTTSSMCVHGDPAGGQVMVVFGDSHAAMWIPALDAIGKEEGWQVVQLTKPGCQAPDFPRYSPTMQREYTECAEYRAWALEQIARLQPDLVVISSSSKDVETWTDGRPEGGNMEQVWGDGLRSVIERIQPNTDRIVILGDMAYPDEPGIDCLTAHPGDVQECTTSRTDAEPEAINAVERAVADETGATYVNTVPWFCTDSECPAVIGGLTTYRDNFHASENYAVWLSNVLGQAIGVIPTGQDLLVIDFPGT